MYSLMLPSRSKYERVFTFPCCFSRKDYIFSALMFFKIDQGNDDYRCIMLTMHLIYLLH